MPGFTPKPPIEKLPLAIRKEIRDEFESKRADLEAQLQALLGYPLAIRFDVNAVWAYAETSGATSPGSVFFGYAESFVAALKSYIEKYGDIGLGYFKNAVTKREVILEVNELGSGANIISGDVKDGVFRILFKENYLGYNQSDIREALPPAINNAPHEGFCLFTKHSIHAEYDSEIESLRSEMANILALPDLVLDPNFEENYAALLKKEDKDWQRNFGAAALEYFQGVKGQLKTQGFEKDDMLQEGFVDGVPKKTIKLRIVNKLIRGSVNETVLEDGIVYVQTTVDYWYYNVYDAGAGILDLL